MPTALAAESYVRAISYPEMTLTKKTAIGAKRTICRIELTMTSRAHMSVSPLA